MPLDHISIGIRVYRNLWPNNAERKTLQNGFLVSWLRANKRHIECYLNLLNVYQDRYADIVIDINEDIVYKKPGIFMFSLNDILTHLSILNPVLCRCMHYVTNQALYSAYTHIWAFKRSSKIYMHLNSLIKCPISSSHVGDTNTWHGFAPAKTAWHLTRVTRILFWLYAVYVVEFTLRYKHAMVNDLNVY